VAESLADWLKEKEAEYQAALLQKEVEKLNQEEEDMDSKVGKGKGGKGAGPRKSIKSGLFTHHIQAEMN
jgi:hypothetical protein